MKCNYQSWRSQHDGIPPSAIRAHAATPPPSRYSLPSRSSSTLAHNLYYGRGAHIINLIKRSALKIVLLVRQLLTAVTFLYVCVCACVCTCLPLSFRCSSFLFRFSYSTSDPLSLWFLPFILSTTIRSLGRALVILALPVVTSRRKRENFLML